jgi:hypothetical protein
VKVGVLESLAMEIVRATSVHLQQQPQMHIGATNRTR